MDPLVALRRLVEDFVVQDRRLEERGTVSTSVSEVDKWGMYLRREVSLHQESEACHTLPKVWVTSGDKTIRVDITIHWNRVPIEDEIRQLQYLEYSLDALRPFERRRTSETAYLRTLERVSDLRRHNKEVLDALQRWESSPNRHARPECQQRSAGMAADHGDEFVCMEDLLRFPEDITFRQLQEPAWSTFEIRRSVLYRAGVFLPRHTALVRTVEITPGLLRVLQEQPENMHSLQPDQFEAFVANRLDRMGYNVSLAGPTTRKDGGIDIIAVPKTLNAGSFVLAAQVKHHEANRKTGRDAVDRLASWNGPFRIGMLVTNTSFTKDAVWAAAQERNKDFIRLRDFIDLKRWLQDQYGSPEDWREIPDKIELAPGIVIEIPKPRLYGAFGEELNLK